MNSDKSSKQESGWFFRHSNSNKKIKTFAYYQ